MSKSSGNINSKSMTRDWLMASFISISVQEYYVQCVLQHTCLEVSFIKEPS